MGKRGPKPRYATPEDMAAAVDAYFESCEAQGVFPDLAGMRVYLNLSQSRLDELCSPPDSSVDNTSQDNNNNYKKYREILSRARDRRESWLAKTATGQPRLATGCMMALKQPSNGGWVDKTADAGGSAVNITIVGAKLEDIGK